MILDDALYFRQCAYKKVLFSSFLHYFAPIFGYMFYSSTKEMLLATPFFTKFFVMKVFFLPKFSLINKSVLSSKLFVVRIVFFAYPTLFLP